MEAEVEYDEAQVPQEVQLAARKLSAAVDEFVGTFYNQNGYYEQWAAGFRQVMPKLIGENHGGHTVPGSVMTALWMLGYPEEAEDVR